MAGELERAEQDRLHMRASDTDRNAVAQRLQHAVDEGRLTLGDYDERLQLVYQARTYGELEKLTADLPAPVASTATVREKKAVERRRETATEWRNWAGLSVMLIAIWAITSAAAGAPLFFWPMFPVGIYGAILLAQLVSGRSTKDD